MQIDQDRIRAILKAEHSYYGGRDIPVREDARWSLGWMTSLIVKQLSPAARVLDVGCGKGHILMELSPSFHTGLGIDNNPEFLRMAEEAKHDQGIHNVDFLLLDYPSELARLQPESFDMVISIRGPVPETSGGLRAALQLLRPDDYIQIAFSISPQVRAIPCHHPESLSIEDLYFNYRLSKDLISPVPAFPSWRDAVMYVTKSIGYVQPGEKVTAEFEPAPGALRATDGRACLQLSVTHERNEQAGSIRIRLSDRVEFVLADAATVLNRYEGLEFVLIDCEKEDYVRFVSTCLAYVNCE